MVRQLRALLENLSLTLILLGGSQLPVIAPSDPMPFLVSTDTVWIRGAQINKCFSNGAKPEVVAHS